MNPDLKRCCATCLSYDPEEGVCVIDFHEVYNPDEEVCEAWLPFDYEPFDELPEGWVESVINGDWDWEVDGK